MKQQINYVPHVACPSCGELSTIGHATKGSEYTWWCDNRECGKQYKWVQNPDDSITAEPTGTVVKYNAALLKMEPRDKPVYLIVDAIDSGTENQRYFYDEHTCPLNYFSQVEGIYLGEDSDPHGLFEFVGSVDKNAEDAELSDFEI